MFDSMYCRKAIACFIAGILFCVSYVSLGVNVVYISDLLIACECVCVVGFIHYVTKDIKIMSE